MTIPRLDLQTVALVIRFKNSISKQLDFPIEETRFQSDSQKVLKYIANNDTRFPAFVMNELNEIGLNSTSEQRRYVPASQNPTKFCTRFILFSKSSFLQTWLNGQNPPEKQVNSINQCR